MKFLHELAATAAGTSKSAALGRVLIKRGMLKVRFGPDSGAKADVTSTYAVQQMWSLLDNLVGAQQECLGDF